MFRTFENRGFLEVRIFRVFFIGCMSDGYEVNSLFWVVKYLEANVVFLCFIKKRVYVFLNYFVNYVEG